MIAWLERHEAPGGALVEDNDDGAREARSATGDHLDDALGTWIYPEWDFTIDDYKPRWVKVTEYPVDPGLPGTQLFLERVRDQYGPVIGRLRRSFEALRPDALRRRRFLVDGDEIDVGAAIDAHAEKRAGGSPSDRLYSRRLPDTRDVCVAFLVDLSSSTNEVANVEGKRIIEVEKEALMCISEALDALGDRFAVYGFSGYGRDPGRPCTRAKAFSEPLTEAVRERHRAACRWKMENRDGAAIRHITKALKAQPARVHLLVLLSDGRPLDCGCDHYYDRYAQEDTHRALQEARQAGVHPFCLTVDARAQDYLEAMYGRGNYTIVERVESLPARLPALYRRLTR